MQSGCRLRRKIFKEITMKITELKEIASNLGEEKIIKMIKAETKKLRKRDGLEHSSILADMVDGLIAEMKSESKEVK